MITVYASRQQANFPADSALPLTASIQLCQQSSSTSMRYSFLCWCYCMLWLNQYFFLQ